MIRVRQLADEQPRPAIQGSLHKLSLAEKTALYLPTTKCHRQFSVMVFLNVNHQVLDVAMHPLCFVFEFWSVY